MINSKIPIKRTALDEAFDSFDATWKYLLNQAQANLDHIFIHERENLIEILRFLVEECHPKINPPGRIIDFAAAGRSLYMGAKTFAHRLSQLGFSVDYPHPEKEICGPPSSIVSKDDVIFAISSSGRTKSVVNKSAFAHKLGCKIIAGTATSNSELTETSPDIILKTPDKINEVQIKSPYPQAFTPLGTLFEFTNAVLWECVSRGLHECIDNGLGFEKSYEIMKQSCTSLTNTALKDLKTCLSHSKDNIHNFITNLILKYFSEHTVHLYGRGKIFNIQIAPFEMRLRQMPHGYITSILNYAPKNRPVKRGQLAILSSGSGSLTLTAGVVRDCDAMVVGLTAHKTDNPFWDLLDLPIFLPGRSVRAPPDWERQQWEGKHADFAPEGIQFEINGSVFFESIFAALCTYLGFTENDLREGHANKQLE
ncbi:MAG: SIS domain-containing protein [Candidatus Helarchaeota archaeon]|nr:SIS domain-containing protein [Candidatus Helarchaeota archaeon]